MGHLHPPIRPKLLCTEYNWVFVFYIQNFDINIIFSQKCPTAPVHPQDKFLATPLIEGLSKKLVNLKLNMICTVIRFNVSSQNFACPKIFFIDANSCPTFFWPLYQLCYSKSKCSKVKPIFLNVKKFLKKGRP